MTNGTAIDVAFPEEQTSEILRDIQEGSSRFLNLKCCGKSIYLSRQHIASVEIGPMMPEKPRGTIQ